MSSFRLLVELDNKKLLYYPKDIDAIMLMVHIVENFTGIMFSGSGRF